MAGLSMLWRMAVFAALGAVAMGIVLPCVAVVRHTTAHDWYAARKLTQTELMTWVGFDELEPIEYRTRDGRVVSVSRYMLRIGEAWFARERILSTIGDHAVMGAWAGFGSVVLFLVLLAWLDRGPPGRGRRETVERAVATRPVGRAAPARLRRRRCAIRRRCAGGRAADRAGDEDRGSGGGSRPRRSPEAADGLRAGGGRGQRQSRPAPGAGRIRRQGGAHDARYACCRSSRQR